MSDSETLSPEEIDRKLNRLNTILGSLDDEPLKLALVRKHYVELDSFPIDEAGWVKLSNLCKCKGKKLNQMKNLIIPLQTQQTVPNYDQILDELEKYVTEFFNSENGTSLACKILAHFKKAKNMGPINEEDRNFVVQLLQNLEFQIDVGVTNENEFYMEAYPETNDIGVNQDWLDAYYIASNVYAIARHQLLLRVKALNEIAHLLTRPFLRYLDPNTKDVDIPIKVRQCQDNMGKVGLCLEEELLGGRLEHSYKKKIDVWNPKTLRLHKVVAKNDRKWFDIKDSAVFRVLKLNPSSSKLSQFKINCKELQELPSEEVGQKRTKSSYGFHQSEHPTKRLVFTGLGISAVGKA